jgi:hypothetical protein
MYFGHLSKEKHGPNGGTGSQMVQISRKPGFSVRTSVKIVLVGFLVREFQYHEKQKRPKRRIFTSRANLDVGKSS